MSQDPSSPSVCPVRDAGVAPQPSCATCSGPPSQAKRRAGSTICREGAPATAVFPLVTGYARETRLAAGQPVGLRLLGPGAIIGIDALWSGRYSATVEALTAVSVCEVMTAQLDAYLDDDADRRRAVERLLTAQIAQLQDVVIRLEAMSAEDRVLSLLREVLADQPANGWMRLPFSRRELAQHLGIAQETVSRMIHRLARKGRLEVDGRLMRLI